MTASTRRPTKPDVPFADRYDGLDCFEPYPGHATFTCSDHPQHPPYPVEVARGVLILSLRMPDNAIFEFLSKPYSHSNWALIPFPGRNPLETKQLALALADAISSNSRKMDAILFGPFPCRRETYTLRVWRSGQDSRTFHGACAQYARLLSLKQELEAIYNAASKRIEQPRADPKAREEFEQIKTRLGLLNQEIAPYICENGDQGDQGGQAHARSAFHVR